MHNYNNAISDDERAAIERALDTLRDDLHEVGTRLAGDDRAAKAAEALATYIVESRA